VRQLYSILFYLALPYIFARQLWRSVKRSPDYRQRLGERLGFCPHTLEKSIWVHTASVGETLAAIPLIKALKNLYPNIPLVVTNMTVTGAARTKAAFGDSVLQAYIPYDLPDAAARFLKRINPIVAIIVETELWPNIFAACKEKNIPIIIANARLSEKSAAGYGRVAKITREMLLNIHTLPVQTEIEKERYVALGLPEERAVVTGSIKFDIEVPAELEEKSASLRTQLGKNRLVWLAASTHATEEDIILDVQRTICELLPDTLLILVPRHPERFNAVFDLVNQKRFKCVRRSSGEICTSDTQVYLGDTMGEMLLLYGSCDIAFVGGSFVPVGGHNMLEAAVLGKPVVTGPQLFNFAEISKLLIRAGGMLKVEDKTELEAAMLRLLQDDSHRTEMGSSARNFVSSNRGALAKHVEITKAIIDKRLLSNSTSDRA
jgi:3-deoxy-D-manno-octulosonic-acid transferase